MMKSKYYTGCIKHLTSDELYTKISELSILCDPESCFVFDNLLCYGQVVPTIKAYLKENPDKPFRTWLIDSNLVIDYNHNPE